MVFDHRKYSPYPVVPRPQRRWPDRVLERAPVYCAVDLRDGNQALVKPMSVEQKAQLFALLVDIGVREIEVGFPAASQPDFDFVRMILEQGLVPEHVTIQVLTQAREDLIARTFEAVRGARRAVVHVYNSTSTVQRERVFEQGRAGIRDIAVRGAECVKRHAARAPETQWSFEYSPESFTGTELDYAAEVVNAVIGCWQPRSGQRVIINLPSTVEMSTPNVFADRIEWMNDHIVDREHIVLSVHPHNDRGCAVASAELAVLAGADRIEGTLLGNGERTGNLDLVTFAMNLYSQGIDPELDLSNMRRIVETVQACTDIPMHPRHPYAGGLVYTAFSGSHQDAIRKSLAKQKAAEPWQVAYLPIDPHDVGRRYEEVVRINSQSGKGGMLHVLERDFGWTLPRWLQLAFAPIVQREAEREGGEVTSVMLRQLFEAAYVHTPRDLSLLAHNVVQEGVGVRIEVVLGRGRFAGHGENAGAALLAALGTFAQGARIELSDCFALKEPSSERAMACVRARVGGEAYTGVGFGNDEVHACLQALLSAVGRAHDAKRSVPPGAARRVSTDVRPPSRTF